MEPLELLLQRDPSERKTTFGDLLADGAYFCDTLEDQVREPANWGLELDTFRQRDAAVALWKIPRETAIPSGRYRVTFQDSTRFGPGTLTINNVPGFSSIRIHGGTTAADTEGCVLVGDKENRQTMKISGAKFDHVLDKLKAVVRKAINEGRGAWITISNATGDTADEIQT